VEAVIPFFERVPLLSTKQADFEKFAHIVREMRRGTHLARAGFDDLLDVALSMNGNGRFRQVRWKEVQTPSGDAYTGSVSDSRSRG
jgi:hypothetical protein